MTGAWAGDRRRTRTPSLPFPRSIGGINWIDTAHAYGFGKSEEVVGRAVKEWSGGEVIIATKCVLPNEVRFPYRDANREKIFEEVEGSLTPAGGLH